jgi:DNA-damage-inducible protein D
MTDAPLPVSPFEQIRHETPEGNEYWSARELGPLLGYQTSYRNFQVALAKARVACATSGQNVADHFADVRTMVRLGSGAQRQVADVHLSRYACYLVVQNADPEKENVALGQTYFAVQTNRAEQMDEMAGLSERQKRLFLRGQLSTHNRLLAATAMGAGVIHTTDFAIFQDHGYMGLYGGLRARDIHARKGLAPSEGILDHMGSTELAANLFRATQTEDKIRRDNIQGKEAANATHQAIGEEVRATIARIGGAMPEDLPTPAESIQEAKRREAERLARGPQLSMFGEEETDPSGE